MSAKFPWQACGYGCGKPWRPFSGTKLVGHAKCALDVPGVRVRFEALNAYRDERGAALTEGQLAANFGVTKATIRAWRSVVEKWSGGYQ